MSVRFWRAVSAATLVLTGCGDGLGPSVQLMENRVKWQQSGIETYELVVSRGCECLSPEMTGPVRVAVRNGVIESRTYMDGTPVPANHGETFPDVPGLFALIQDAIDRNSAELTVRYHPTHGVPTRIFVDYHPTYVDDEIVHTISFTQGGT